MLWGELAGALQDDLAFAQDQRDRAEVPSAQQIRDEVFDDRDELGADRPRSLELEQVEQHREDVAAQVLGVFALDLFVQILDFLVVEEVERGVEVVDRHEAFALRRDRSEEHTSELQSLAYLVCRLLL